MCCNFEYFSASSVINKIHSCVAWRRLLMKGDGRRTRVITYTLPRKCWWHATVQQWSMPKPDIRRESRFFHDNLHSMPPLILIVLSNKLDRGRHRLRCFIHRLISPMHQTCTRLLLNSSVDLLRVIKLRCWKLKLIKKILSTEGYAAHIKTNVTWYDSPRCCFIPFIGWKSDASMHTSVRCIGEISRWIKQRSHTISNRDVTLNCSRLFGGYASCWRTCLPIEWVWLYNCLVQTWQKKTLHVPTTRRCGKMSAKLHFILSEIVLLMLKRVRGRFGQWPQPCCSRC